MKNYFDRFQYNTAELKDFMECFNEAYQKTEGDKIDLISWMDSWLKTSGVNTLKGEVVEDNGKWYLEVEQQPDKYGDKILRE